MWVLKVHNKAAKALPDLPELARLAFAQLARELIAGGPRPQGWPHYGKIKGHQDQHHCHLKRGRPTYVAVWRELKNEERTIEVIYVGTHEKAPY
jgi:mRNA-degrading endonuclease RelE of RelBE toxin-antitoxin system